MLVDDSISNINMLLHRKRKLVNDIRTSKLWEKTELRPEREHGNTCISQCVICRSKRSDDRSHRRACTATVDARTPLLITQINQTKPTKQLIEIANDTNRQFTVIYLRLLLCSVHSPIHRTTTWSRSRPKILCVTVKWLSLVGVCLRNGLV